MTCGPAAALDRDPLAPVLRCARCGAEERVPALPLFVVTGASGAGKTTVTGPLRRLLPDCPDDVLAARLRARPSWRHSSLETAIAEHQRFAAWLRTHIQPCYDTSALTPDETAAQIAAWVRAAVCSGDDA